MSTFVGNINFVGCEAFICSCRHPQISSLTIDQYCRKLQKQHERLNKSKEIFFEIFDPSVYVNTVDPLDGMIEIMRTCFLTFLTLHPNRKCKGHLFPSNWTHMQFNSRSHKKWTEHLGQEAVDNCLKSFLK